MRFFNISPVSFSIMFLHINQVKSHPQTKFPSSQREVPHEVDCTVRYRPAPADVSTNFRPPLADSGVDSEGCECVPYYLCNSNKTADVGVAFLSGVGLVSSPPYKPCPCTQGTSSSKPNNAGVCPNYLDVCCIQQPPTQFSDEYPGDKPSWNENIPGNPPPWQNSPGNSPPWNNNAPGSFPSWNNNQPGNSPPWSNNSPGYKPSWNNNSQGNRPPWKINSAENSRPWNSNSPGNRPTGGNNSPENSPPWGNNSPGSLPPWNENIPGNSPPWTSKPADEKPWKNNQPGNPTFSNEDSSGNKRPWNLPGPPYATNQPSENSPAWIDNFPGCGRYFNNELGLQTQEYQGETEQYDSPWMIAVYGDKVVNGMKKRTLFLCGGSLINPDIVLTAAHCIKGRSSLMIRAGGSGSGAQERHVHHMKVHEEYYAGALYNDIALLFLESPLDLGPNIGTVCLPQPGVRVNLRDCIVNGWGTRAFGTEENHETAMKKIEMSVVPRRICEEKLQTTRLGRYFRLHESFICAKGKRGQDACTGDGGGPLVCSSVDNSRRLSYVQVGVVSWGIGCGGDIPGVYVNVTHFQPWIDREMAILNVDERFRTSEK